jgi:hypothetical protein
VTASKRKPDFGRPAPAGSEVPPIDWTGDLERRIVGAPRSAKDASHT